MEPASGWRVDQPGNFAADLAQFAPWLRQAFQQTHRVGMAGALKEIIDRRHLYFLPSIHHRDAVADFVCGAEVMRREQHRHAAFLDEPLQQLENLRLDGDVERGRGLVRDDEIGLGHQRERDHQPLPLAAGEFVRQLVEGLVGARDLHRPHHLDSVRLIGLAARPRVAAEKAKHAAAGILGPRAATSISSLPAPAIRCETAG